MKIDIIVNPTNIWGPDDLELGLLNGSEEMVVSLARSLSSLGHKVRVFATIQSPTLDGDIEYHSNNDLFNMEGDALIAFKDPMALQKGNYEKRFLWTADANILDSAQRRICDGLVAISPWHERELRGINMGFNSIFTILPGVDKYETLDPPDRKHKQLLYASSHDRGLSHLLEIFPTIKKAHPDVSLYVTYGERAFTDENGVIYTGRLTDSQMTRLYMTSDILAYPCTGQERYCITVAKAQLYGCIPLVVPHMALSTTTEHGVKSNLENFEKNLRKLLNESTYCAMLRKDMQKYTHPNWGDIALQWIDLINGR